MTDNKFITGTDLFDFGQCNHRVYLNTHGDPSLKVKLDPATEKLLEDGVLHEEAVVSDFVFRRTKGTFAEREQQTIKLMEEGAALIYHGILTIAHYRAEPDLLKRVESPSKFGEYSYVPVEIKSAKHPTHEHFKQLFFYCYVLELLQAAPPKIGVIINSERDWLEFNFGDDERTDVLAALSTIEQIHQEKWTAGPTLISHCKKCPWQAHCLEYMRLNEDVSLVHKLGKTDKGKFHDAGITKLSTLAGHGIDELEKKITTISGKKLARYRIQAEALQSGSEILLKTPEFPRADLEIHLDFEIESSHDICYLYGLLIDDGKQPQFKPIVAEGLADERKAWEEFQDFLESLPENIVIYHWAAFEPMWLRKLSNKYGVSKRVNEIIENKLFDLHKKTEAWVAFPLSSYSLKDVARHLGFDWRDKEIGGALSMLWYLEWLESGKRAVFDKILRYNEDDVRATKYIKDWLVGVKEKNIEKNAN